jgi:hypothetical protein
MKAYVKTGYTALPINLIRSGGEWSSSKDFTKTIWKMENKYHGTWIINKLITGGYWTDYGVIYETTQHSFHDQYSLLLIYQCFGGLKGLMFIGT